MLITLSAIAVAAAAPVGSPAPQPQPQAQPSPAAAPARPTTYCIAETPTGSRIAKKACRTRAEWLDRGVDPVKGD